MNLFSLNMNIFNFHKLKNHLKDQICHVSIVGWCLLSGFVVEGIDFCDSLRV
jgi:hypothetical protein